MQFYPKLRTASDGTDFTIAAAVWINDHVNASVRWRSWCYGVFRIRRRTTYLPIAFKKHQPNLRVSRSFFISFNDAWLCYALEGILTSHFLCQYNLRLFRIAQSCSVQA